MFVDRFSPARSNLSVKLAWAILALMYFVSCSVISTIYAVITGAHEVPSSVIFAAFTVTSPLILFVIVMMWFSKQTKQLLSLEVRILFTATWFAPTLVWVVSIILSNFGFVKSASFLFEFRYFTLPFFLLGIYFWALNRIIHPLINRTKKHSSKPVSPASASAS